MTKLLTLPEAAVCLRVSRATLFRLIASKEIRTLHPSKGRTVIDEREIENYLARLRRTA
jgi:excisionase family DNA binding protein